MRVIVACFLFFLSLICEARPNECVKPVPGTETRAVSAGWKPGSDWMAVAEDIARGVIACAKEAVAQMPDAIHSCLAKHKVRNVEYVNPASWFINPDGSMKTELYSRDHLHLSRQGYSVWSKEIVKL